MSEIRDVSQKPISPPPPPVADDAAKIKSVEAQTPAEESSFLDKIGTGVSDVFEVASAGLDAITGAGEKVADAVTDAVTSPLDLGGMVDTMFDKAGAAVQQGAELLSAGFDEAVGMIPRDISEPLHGVIEDAQRLGTTLLETPVKTLELGRQIGEQAIEAGKTGLSLLDDVRQNAASGWNVIGTAIDQMVEGAEKLVQGGTQLLSDIRDAVDVEKKIEGLNSNGDKVILGLGGSGSVEGFKVAAKGTVEVERKGEPPKYVVTADGEVAGGVYAEAGGRVGVSASARAEALLGVGGKVEMTFNTPQEAARAVETLERMAAAQALKQAVQVPGAGVALDAVVGPSADDLQFLGDHTTAIELKGNVAASAAATLGIGLDDKLRLAGLSGKVSAKDQLSLRIDLPHDNKPARVTVAQEFTAAGEASGGIGLSQKGQGGGKTGIVGRLEGKVSVKIEQSVTLPSQIDTGRLLSQPVAALADLASQVQRGDDVVTIKAAGTGQALGNGGTVEAELKLRGNVDQILQSGAIGSAIDGDIPGALDKLGDQIRVDAKVDTINTDGLKVNPEISVMGFGVGLELEYTTNDREPLLGPYSGTLNQVRDDLTKMFEDFQPAPADPLSPAAPPLPPQPRPVAPERELQPPAPAPSSPSVSGPGSTAPVSPADTRPLTPLTISGSVGAGGANRPEDVRQVQEALTTLGYLPAGYTPGQIDAATINAISNYQQTNHLPVVDGRIDVNLYTMRHINQQAVGLTATPATGPQTQPAAGPQTQTVAGPQPPVTLPPVTGAGDARVAELQQRAVATARGEWQAGVHERPNGSNSGPRVDQYAARAGFGPGHEWCGFFTGFALSENGFKDPSKLASYQKARDYFMYRDYTARTNSPVNQRNDELRAQHAAQGSSRQYFMLEESPTRQRVEQPGSWGRGRYGHYDADANTFNYQNIPVRGGDVVLFNRGHVGLVESYNPATGRLVTIEGNASGTGPDGRRANNAVVRREYDLTDPAVRRQFDGFGRPAAGDFR